MGGKNHHSEPFDESTLVKLDFYRRYVRAWLPVFLNADKLVVDRIQIFDFFAGPGRDKNGASGSPLIALEEIRAAMSQPHRNNPEIHLYLNEFTKGKYEALKRVCSENDLPYVRFHFQNEDFPIAFDNWKAEFWCGDRHLKAANLLFLDQNGTKQITKSVFTEIASAAITDFLFFIASSYIYRFRDQPQNLAGTPIEAKDLEKMTMKNAHRVVCDAYRRWLPSTWNYYLAPFSIAKDCGSNVYGLIFGSGHPLGMDKFLKICWDEDPLTGQANYDMDDDNIVLGQMTFWEERPKKITAFEMELEAQVLSRKILTNVDVYKFSLNRGFRASHAKAALQRMIKEKKLPSQTFAISYESCGKPKIEARAIAVRTQKDVR